MNNPSDPHKNNSKKPCFGPMIQCETFIFKPSNNGIVNFSYKMNIDEEMLKQAGRNVSKSENMDKNKESEEEVNGDEGYYFDDAISDEDFEAKLQAYYAGDKKAIKEAIESAHPVKKEQERERRAFYDDFCGGVPLPGEDNVLLKAPGGKVRSHPLVPEIKSFNLEEMMKRGYKKVVHADGRIEHVMTPEVQALFKASPEYKEFLRRSTGTEFTPVPNVQLKIVSKEAIEGLEVKDEIVLEPIEVGAASAIIEIEANGSDSCDTGAGKCVSTKRRRV